jgi:hypothetical protein
MGSTKYMAQKLKYGDAAPRQILNVNLFHRFPMTPDEFCHETSAIGKVIFLAFHAYKERPNPSPSALVEREALVRAFSPGSTLEPGLKGFHRRGH